MSSSHDLCMLSKTTQNQFESNGPRNISLQDPDNKNVRFGVSGLCSLSLGLRVDIGGQGFGFEGFVPTAHNGGSQSLRKGGGPHQHAMPGAVLVGFWVASFRAEVLRVRGFHSGV